MVRRAPDPGLLTVSLLSADAEAEAAALALVEEAFGEIAVRSPAHPFPWTEYYRDEVGDSPVRRYLAFRRLLPREELPDRKLETIALEAKLAAGGKRTVNVDAGCLTQGQLFLASTKDQKQRVYAGRGIYVEPTLYFQDGAWRAFPWSYPDYSSPTALAWLEESRRLLRSLLRA